MSKVECYIVGAKGVSFYGGYESFVQKLLQYHKDNKDIHYHVACKANGDGAMEVDKLDGTSNVVDNHFTYCNADCHLIHVNEKLGPAQAIAYDIQALKLFCKHIEDNHIHNPIVYILACRIGPFMKKYVKKIHRLGGKVYLNPDGECEIIRGCHNRDKGTTENERLHDPKFIFSYPENEQNIFLDSLKAARKEISTKRAG